MSKIDTLLPVLSVGLYIVSLALSAAMIREGTYTITYLLFDVGFAAFIGFMLKGGK